MTLEDVAIELKMIQRQLDKHEADGREVYGLLKELSGKVSVTSGMEALRDDMAEIRTHLMKQAADIGGVKATAAALVDALKKSSDTGLASAAAGINITVAGGTTVNNEGGVGTQNVAERIERG